MASILDPEDLKVLPAKASILKDPEPVSSVEQVTPGEQKLVSVKNSLKTLGTAIKQIGVSGFSDSNKKAWWKGRSKFPIGLINSKNLESDITIYGEYFDLSKKLSAAKRLHFKKDTCSYDVLDITDKNLDSDNYKKAKSYGIDIEGVEEDEVSQFHVKTATEFEKLYLSWIDVDTPAPGAPAPTPEAAPEATPEATPEAAPAPSSEAAPAPGAPLEGKLRKNVLKGLFRFIFGKKDISKISSYWAKYRAGYTWFNVDEKIPCQNNPLWTDFKRCLEYRQDQAICELSASNEIIGTEYNNYIIKKKELCLGLRDLIDVLNTQEHCFDYSGTEYQGDGEYTDDDYARALRVFDNFVNEKNKADKINKLRSALAGLKEPSKTEQTPYTELYKQLVASLEALTNPKLEKENKDLRNVVRLLTQFLNISNELTDILLKAKDIYCRIHGCCKPKLPQGELAAANKEYEKYEKRIEEIRTQVEGLTNGNIVLENLVKEIAEALNLPVEDHGQILERIREFRSARDGLMGFMDRIERIDSDQEISPEELARLNELLNEVKYGDNIEKIIGELKSGLEGKVSLVIGNPIERLKNALAKVTANTDKIRDEADAALAKTEEALSQVDVALVEAEKELARKESALADVRAERDSLIRARLAAEAAAEAASGAAASSDAAASSGASSDAAEAASAADTASSGAPAEAASSGASSDAAAASSGAPADAAPADAAPADAESDRLRLESALAEADAARLRAESELNAALSKRNAALSERKAALAERNDALSALEARSSANADLASSISATNSNLRNVISKSDEALAVSPPQAAQAQAAQAQAAQAESAEAARAIAERNAAVAARDAAEARAREATVAESNRLRAESAAAAQAQAQADAFKGLQKAREDFGSEVKKQRYPLHTRTLKGGGNDNFYKSLLVLLLLDSADYIKPKEFLKKLKATMADAGQEDLVMELLRKIIDKSLKIKVADGCTFSPVDLDQKEVEGLQEAYTKNFGSLQKSGIFLHAEPPEEFRDALGEGPYFLILSDDNTLYGLDEEIELSKEEKDALAGGISMTAVLAMYILGLEDSFDLEE